MLRFHDFLYIPMLLCLQACAPAAGDDASVHWNDINYSAIACGTGKSSTPGCKSDESGMGTTSGHHGAHSK